MKTPGMELKMKNGARIACGASGSGSGQGSVESSFGLSRGFAEGQRAEIQHSVQNRGDFL